MELAQERAAAEAEAQRAKEAIQAKERELQQIEVERQQEVKRAARHMYDLQCGSMSAQYMRLPHNLLRRMAAQRRLEV